MGKEFVAVIALVGTFSSIILCVYFIIRYKSLVVRSGYVPQNRIKTNWMKPGILLIGIGIGLIIVNVLKQADVISSNSSAAIGIVVLCAGIAMVIANLMDKTSVEE